LSPSSVRRIHATLRSALNDAVRRRVIRDDPAALAELEPTRRPKVRPWEPEELGAFLDYAAVACVPLHHTARPRMIQTSSSDGPGAI
jgi:hypothetical protein